MQIDALVAEIGSTTTVVNAFTDLAGVNPRFLGQGKARTTVEEGDVSLGLELAIADLKQELNCPELTWTEMLASSSAAGGLRMSCHGLVYDMTVRAAREACLGSGAVIKQVTAGKLRPADLRQIEAQQPNIAFVAGGTDYGEWETALGNAGKIMEHFPKLPLIYAGNAANLEEVQELAARYQAKLYCCENVYPSLDQLNIEPARRLIHQVFEEHIVRSAGMEKIRQLVTGTILPTPGAVMECALLAQELLGDLLVVDIGGATTDVHSVSEGNPNYLELLTRAEPFAKRSVEGDLGVFVNRIHLLEKFSEQERAQRFPRAAYFLQQGQKIPTDAAEINFVEELSQKALELALERHCGKWIEIFSATGATRLIEGKDLSQVRFVLGTGGALTRLPRGESILQAYFTRPAKKLLLPQAPVEVLLDHDYIMASLGVLARSYPQAARRLLEASLRLN